VYTDWFSQTEPRVKGARGAKYKGFATRAEAESFAIHGRVDTGNDPYGPSSSSSGHRQPLQPLSQSQRQRQVQVSNASLNRPIKTEKSPTPAKRSIEADGKLLDVDDASKFAKYYAVAIGRRPGIYEEWDGKRGAKEQTDGFSGALHQRFNDHKSAISFMYRAGIARDEILLFNSHFAKRANFNEEVSVCTEQVGRTLRSTTQNQIVVTSSMGTYINSTIVISYKLNRSPSPVYERTPLRYGLYILLFFFSFERGQSSTPSYH
jgi:viroplasmin and RNaseH domain-containing protein